jgi:hypothetical protein
MNGTLQLISQTQSTVPLNITVKAFFTTIEEIHRFVIAADTNFTDFNQQLVNLYNSYVESNSTKDEDDNFLEEFEKKMSVKSNSKDEHNINSTDLVLKYQDDEDDWVMLKSEQVCFHFY